MLEERLAGHHAAIAWPASSGEIPDEEPRFQIAYLSLDIATKPPTEKETLAREFLEKCGSKPRLYKNGLALAIPAADQTESLRREVRYFIAVDRVSKAAHRHHLTKEQADELRERRSTHESSAESAFVKLYPEVWLPKLEKDNRTDQSIVAIEKIAAGGRPLQATVSGNRKAMVFERSMELLTVVQSRVFLTLKPTKIVELFRLGEDQPPRLAIRCSEVVSGFYSFLGFTRLTSKDVIQRATAEGVGKGIFGYFSGSVPTLDVFGKYQVARPKVRFNVPVSDDEIDLESGFLMLPQSILDEATPQTTTGPVPLTPSHDEPSPHPEPATGKGAQAPTEKVFQVSFTANRDKLYNAWSAAANLADIAGEVEVSLRAESETGFDRSKLQNGVLEPLREADLI